jgi:hypothetical protein
MKNIGLILLVLLCACSSTPEPKDVVFDFIKAVKTSDSLAVTQLLDIDEYIKIRMTEMSPEDSVAVIEQERIGVIDRLLREGKTREYWNEEGLKFVVNRARIYGDSAYVDVSYMEKTGRLIYTNMILKRYPDKNWKIIYFKEP